MLIASATKKKLSNFIAVDEKMLEDAWFDRM
jgi:hypothetical protein